MFVIKNLLQPLFYYCIGKASLNNEEPNKSGQENGDKSSDEIDINMKFNIITRFIKCSLEVGTFVICVILLYNKIVRWNEA